MTGSKTLLPLRIPELGPSLGKLVTGTGQTPGGLDLSGARHQLVTRVFEHAGEARRLIANEERAPAIAALARANWLAAWEEAVASVAEVAWKSVEVRLLREAAVVAMPLRVRGRIFPGATEHRALVTRLGSAGAGLVRALDDLERRGKPALDATGLERSDMDAWQNSLRTAARRLEDAWIVLEDRVGAELGRFDSVVDRVARWRKPLWPVWVTGGAALLVAVWLGLVLGGFVPAPAFLQPLVNAWPQ